MKIYFLGTNGWYDTETGNTVCVLIETKKEYVIFDAGSGFYKIDRYIKQDKPVFLFLSHYHLDHVIGFHTLVKFKFKQGIDIFGPPGLKLFFRNVIKTPYSVPISRLSMRIGLHEIKSAKLLPLWIEYRALRHASICYGYRVILEGKTIVYCTDTGVCRNFSLLAKGADFLIAECSLKKKQENSKWPHLNSEQSAKIAYTAKCKKLALIHFDAGIYLNRAGREEAGKTARKIFRNTIVANDGLSIDL